MFYFKNKVYKIFMLMFFNYQNAIVFEISIVAFW